MKWETEKKGGKNEEKKKNAGRLNEVGSTSRQSSRTALREFDKNSPKSPVVLNVYK